MHYYQFHIGDFRSATMHLSNDEELAYRRLLDWYYDTEKPIPIGTQSVARRLRVDAETVLSVLRDFFTETPDGWVHERCESEISRYVDKAEKNRQNGKKGGRPPARDKNPLGYQSVPSGNPVESGSNPNQEPITNNQEPEDQKPCDQQAGSPRERVPFEKIREVYNRVCAKKLPEALKLDEKRKRNIRKCYHMEIDGAKPFQAVAFWEQYFSECLLDEHWTGKNDRGWRADIEFLTRESTVLKVLERS